MKSKERVTGQAIALKILDVVAIILGIITIISYISFVSAYRREFNAPYTMQSMEYSLNNFSSLSTYARANKAANINITPAMQEYISFGEYIDSSSICTIYANTSNTEMLNLWTNKKQQASSKLGSLSIYASDVDDMFIPYQP